MNQQYYLDLAASGLRMPIGTDLMLREKPDHDAILLDGERLGKVIEAAARRYKTPLAIPLMDLTVEKQALLRLLDVPEDRIPSYHFSTISDEVRQTVAANVRSSITPRMKANVDAIRYVAGSTDLLPCGMSIGPFSLMTKLIADPIGPVYMAGTGITGAEDAEVLAIERALELGLGIIMESVRAQIEAGAKAILVCEPAANKVYLSPKQLAKGSDIFERFVMQPNRVFRKLLADSGVDLIFHDCGELIDDMVSQFATLEPVMMSLGSSRVLWEDAARVPKNIVLYGNLPSKRFYSDDLITVADVEASSCELIARMKAADHPFILGSECDVLSVPGSHDTIIDKVAALIGCKC